MNAGSVDTLPGTTTTTYTAALGAAIAEEMRADDRVFIMGQDVATLGGSFGTTRGLSEELGTERVRNTAINEPFAVGCAAGAAMAGMRPLVNLVFADFALIAADELFHKLAKWRYMHGGQHTLPAVILLPVGLMGGSGPEHSGSLEMLGMHFPGLRVAIPATPADAKGMLKTAIRDDNPVLFHPVKLLYWERGEVPDDPEVTVPFGQAVTRRTGSDVTVVTYGATLPRCLRAAENLAADGIELEVIDLRTLVPLDMATVLASVRRTNRVMVVHEAVRTAGAGAEIAARVQEEAFFDLEEPVRRVAGADVPMPQHPQLEWACVPSADGIADTARTLLAR